MKRRISIYLDVELEKKLKVRQADLLIESRNSISFSHILNQTLRDVFAQDERLEVMPSLDTVFRKI